MINILVLQNQYWYYYKFTAEAFDTTLKQTDLLTKTDFDTKLVNLNQNINSNKAKHLLVKKELKKLQTADSSYFIDKSDFKQDGAQYHFTQRANIFHPFTQRTNIAKGLTILIMFYNGSRKDCLMKVLNLLLHLKIFSIFHQTIMVVK